ncbi:helix-turn-helix domain-containing protein [Saccharothrix variisporea]|uniref:helix-turn-helix domain-containing protein n=1 Tax=Saccharothrix variisporea TaxID=543527 RepID=UPI000EAC2961|nr:helix-turn-helix domain-containing protein [Saccharothrix variisporea]
MIQPSKDEALPRLHTAQEVADALGVSKWWVKDRARRQEIPTVKVGGTYRFTTRHYADIVAQFEQQPRAAGEKTIPRRRRRSVPPSEPATVLLQARTPRRRRQSGG